MATWIGKGTQMPWRVSSVTSAAGTPRSAKLLPACVVGADWAAGAAGTGRLERLRWRGVLISVLLQTSGWRGGAAREPYAQSTGSPIHPFGPASAARTTPIHRSDSRVLGGSWTGRA